jgi:hypothetical protein
MISIIYLFNGKHDKNHDYHRSSIYIYNYIYNDPLIWIDCLHHDPLADCFMIVFLPDRTNIFVGNMIGDVYIMFIQAHADLKD